MRLLESRGSRLLRFWRGKTQITQKFVFNILWFRSGMWQKVHMSIIWQSIDTMVLSGYHGPAVQERGSQVDFHRAVQEDIRPIVGKNLPIDAVSYPTTNPRPPTSKIRRGL